MKLVPGGPLPARGPAMKVGNITMNPARSPGVLDTATWDPAAAVRQVTARADAWCSWHRSGRTGAGSLATDVASVGALGCRAIGSVVLRGESSYLLAQLGDARAIVERVALCSFGERSLG